MSLNQGNNMCNINKYNFKIKKALNSKLIDNFLFKVFLDYDIVFYSLSFDKIKTNLVYNEEEFYDSTIEGTPAFLKLQKPNSKKYEYFPEFCNHKLDRGQEYAIITYKYTGWYSTRAVATVQCLNIFSIKILKHK